jgi:hypothetical protein
MKKGTFGEHSGNIQGTSSQAHHLSVRAHPHGLNRRPTPLEHSTNIQRTFNEH